MATQSKLFTYDDWLKLPEDCYKYEIVKGELITRPTPPTIHQLVSGNLLFHLSRYLDKNEIGEVFLPIDVVLSMTDVVQPDLMFISNERSQIITEKNIVEAPDLVIEIVSESTKVRDQTTKKALYKKYGVKEYWIVYPDEKKVDQFVLKDGVFELKGEIAETEELSSKIVEGFTISTDQIFSD